MRSSITLYLTVLVLVLYIKSGTSFSYMLPIQGSTFLRQLSRPIFLSMTSIANSNTEFQSEYRIPSNDELVAQRLRLSQAKRMSHRQSIQEVHDRNMRLKSIVSTERQNGDTVEKYPVPSLYAIKLSVCPELREELKLNGREKRGRVFVETNSTASQTMRGLRLELHSFFRALRKSTYLLHAKLPKLDDSGNIVQEHENTWNDTSDIIFTLESDDDVRNVFAASEQFFEKHSEKLSRPSLLLHVVKDPNAPPEPGKPAYLEDMANPADTESMTMLSFYAFPPQTISNPEDFAIMLRSVWKPFQLLGRVYIAREGVNAQMSVPTNVLENFRDCCRSIPELGDWMENGINIDPKPLSIEEFATAGVPVRGKPAPPFRNLHIRVRNQVVADGLEKPLNWQSAGYDMPPLEWHQKLKEARDQQLKASQEGNGQSNGPILLDCRNKYETDVGRFDLAEPLGTENFRETWDVIKDRLADIPKDSPIMMYCTGGIRCVKVGAYVTQELGFTNVSRLAGGIIAYDRTLKEKDPEAEPLFKGTNFVFDGRLGRPITEDDFGQCITCGSETSLVTNCMNDNCHKRMIQCENCREAFLSTCSDACKLRVMNKGMLPKRMETVDKEADNASKEGGVRYETLEEYSSGHSSPPPSFYREIELNTKQVMPTGAHMISGSSQGRWLTQLASLTREGRILELGTFTGYATACLLEGAANVGAAIGYSGLGSADGGPYVMSFERDPRALNVAVAHLRVMTEYGVNEEGAEAACALRSNNYEFPVVNEDLVSMTYNDVATCDVIRVTDALATLEQMAAGTGNFNPAPFDMVFVDADKTRLLEYAEALIGSDRVLKKGGLIVVDNVLWKGLVVDVCNGDFKVHEESDDESDGDTSHDMDSTARKGRRSRKLANKMHKFNSQIVKDHRVEVLVLPMRDGLSVIRKR
jgi:predicted sulfurtransferase/predicted O-methyltransferase YrrM